MFVGQFAFPVSSGKMTTRSPAHSPDRALRSCVSGQTPAATNAVGQTSTCFVVGVGVGAQRNHLGSGIAGASQIADGSSRVDEASAPASAMIFETAFPALDLVAPNALS